MQWKKWLGGTKIKNKKRLAPQSCVAAVQSRAQRPTGYKQFGTGLVVAVGVHGIGEGMNVWEVTPPRLVMVLKAAQNKNMSLEERKAALGLLVFLTTVVSNLRLMYLILIKINIRAYQPAFSCSEFKNSISWALPIPTSWIKRVLQESLSPDIIEEKGTLTSSHRHDVLIETHWTDPWQRHVQALM